MITTPPDSENSNMSNDLEASTASYSHSDPFGSGAPNVAPSESPQPASSQQQEQQAMGPPGSRPYSEQEQQDWQQGYGGGSYYPAYSQSYSQGGQGWTPASSSSYYPSPGYQGYYPPHPQYHQGSHSDQYNSYGYSHQMAAHHYYNSSSSNGGGSNNCTPSPHAGSDDSGGDAVNEVKQHPYYHQKGKFRPPSSNFCHLYGRLAFHAIIGLKLALKKLCFPVLTLLSS